MPLSPVLVDLDPATPPVPLTIVDKEGFASWLADQPDSVRRWLTASGFAAEPGSVCLIPAADGALTGALAGGKSAPGVWEWAAIAARLPGSATFQLATGLPPDDANKAALGWSLAAYRFDRYRRKPGNPTTLVWPDGCDRATVTAMAEATALVRDLITTPSADMGPAELAAAGTDIAGRYGAHCTVIAGDDLLANNWPCVHAVGRASSRPPRLIDLRWGDDSHPKVTLVGKGVCFDSGGLDLKPAGAMKLMKKDMGGAAIVLGLAALIMGTALPIRLRVLIPAVENSVAGNAYRPLDVLTSRKGTTIEIGNTDAEGRVILADALFEAAGERPALLVDCATLTGAARVALGTELPALFCNDDLLADDVLAAGRAAEDPLWRLPLWAPYRRQIEGKTADLTNAPEGGFAGAITAALFLAEFVGADVPWVHLDVMAWNADNRPGRPEGGEAMGMRALYTAIRQRFAG